MLTAKKSDLLKNHEFHSALVRLGIWLFAVIYVYAGALSERYAVDMQEFSILFALYLLFFSGLLASVFYKPAWRARLYFSLVVDISATTWCIYLTGEASSPFLLLYIWIFVSYGTRWGRELLTYASILSLIAYSLVISILGQWTEYLFEVSFVLLVLALLPVYEYALLSRLHTARAEAENSNKLMGRFLSHITNEMRSPLADVLATANSLGNSGLTLKQMDKVDEMSSSVALLDAVIGDVLDFSKLEAHQIQIQSVPFNLQSLLSEVFLIANRLSPGNNFICSISPHVPKVVVGDEQRLRQVLVNVVKTAIRNSGSNELKLSVELDKDKPCILLFEIDAVGGVETKHPFQISNHVNDDYVLSEKEQNPYLGVSLGRKLMHLMKGELGSIWGESGSIFWLRLPVEQNEFDLNEKQRYAALQGKRVFLFDTNPNSSKAIESCCKQAGMIVRTMGRVGEITETISEPRRDREVDLILVVDSPGAGGVARVADICLEVLGDDLPLIVLSSRRDVVNQKKYKSAVVIKKPLILDHLVDAYNSVSAAADKDGHPVSN